jgi:hypothetical protein
VKKEKNTHVKRTGEKEFPEKISRTAESNTEQHNKLQNEPRCRLTGSQQQPPRLVTTSKNSQHDTTGGRMEMKMNDELKN